MQTGSNSSRGGETVPGVNQCVKKIYDEKGYVEFKNICSFKINFYWCVGYECNSNNGRLISLKPGRQYPALAGKPGKNEVKYAACPHPYGIDHSSETGSFNGNFICRP